MSDTEYRAEQIAVVAREMARLDLVNVVRCRDCEHYDSERYGCWWVAHAERQSDYSWADEPSDVEPDGFCAWGERRTNEQRTCRTYP